eukprot:c16405_g1_i1.p1 GENE.c16405_g1_i1~~c16405_g1_i1.p1  ORF type:complete len:361 (+),score=64.29 c16405_g1_i1:45-1127(+)
MQYLTSLFPDTFLKEIKSSGIEARPLNSKYGENDETEEKLELFKSRKEKVIPSQFYGIFVCVFYAVSSTVITLVNKATFTHYHFPYQDVLFLFQILFSIFFLFFFRWLKWINFQNFSFTQAKHFVILSLSFVGMVLFSLVALRLNNVPMYSALLRQTTLMVLVQEYIVLKIFQPLSQVCCIIIMCGGAIVAAWNDLHGSYSGYTMGLVTCFFTSSYTVHVKKISENESFHLFDIMLYNNVLSLFPILLLTLFSGNLQKTFEFELWSSWDFVVCFAFSSGLAFVLNYSIFLCTQVHSPLTTSVIGNLKNLVTDLVGLFAFNDVKRTPLYMTGILIATLGALLYSYFKTMTILSRSKVRSRY